MHRRPLGARRQPQFIGCRFRSIESRRRVTLSLVDGLSTSATTLAIPCPGRINSYAGDNFVCSTDIYGGTWNLFQNTMSTMGITCGFVDPADPENFRRATDERTRCYYGETLPNPS